jgi:hypothetical protein
MCGSKKVATTEIAPRLRRVLFAAAHRNPDGNSLRSRTRVVRQLHHLDSPLWWLPAPTRPLVELGLGRAIYGPHEVRHFGTTRSTTRHDKFWAVPARHECEGRAVPRISAR